MTNLSLPETMQYFNKKYLTIQKLETLVRQKGYAMIEADLLENYEKFKDKHKRIDKNSMVKLIDKEGQVKVLRPDVTTSIIDNVAAKWSDNTPLKVFYNETIFLNTSSGIEEKKQFGIEYLGKNSIDVDLEVLTLAKKMFESFDFDFIIEINDALLIDELFEALNLADNTLEKLKAILDKKDVSRLNKFVDKYLSDAPYQTFLKSLLDMQGDFKTISEALNKLDVPSNVKARFDKMKSYETTLGSNNIVFDLSMQSDYGYYQGVIFKGYIASIPKNVLNGGRYNTQSMGAKQSIDACGFSLSLDDILKERMN